MTTTEAWTPKADAKPKKKTAPIKATLEYAQLRDLPGQEEGSGVNNMSERYQVNLVNLSNQAVAALEELGLTVLENPAKPEKGKYITPKSKYEIVAVDADGDEIPRATRIGNGSKANVIITAYDWKSPAGKTGTSSSISKLIITDLVEYAAEESEVQQYGSDDFF